jgi:hypothetical protein
VECRVAHSLEPSEPPQSPGSLPRAHEAEATRA